MRNLCIVILCIVCVSLMPYVHLYTTLSNAVLSSSCVNSYNEKSFVCENRYSHQIVNCRDVHQYPKDSIFVYGRF